MKKSTPFTRSALHTASAKMPVASFNWIWKWWRGACILLFPTPLSTALASQVDMIATGKTLERVRDCKPLASSSIVTGQWCSAFPDTDTNPIFLHTEANQDCHQVYTRVSLSVPRCPGLWQKQYHLSTLVLEELLSRSYWVACLSSAFPLASKGKAGLIKLLSCVRKNPSAAKWSHCGHSGKSYCLYTS